MKQRKSQAGFSLIELMIVVVIIGVLAGVGIPQYQRFQMKAKQSEVKTLLTSMYTAQKAFYAEWNQYYADFNAVGYGLSGDLGYNVGFTGNINGPSTHPNADYQTTASVRTAQTFCNGNDECSISKSGVTGIPTSTLTTNSFTFGGRAELDDDNARDDWSINEDRKFSHLNDDITKVN